MIARVLALCLIGGILFSQISIAEALSIRNTASQNEARDHDFIDELVFFGESTTAHLRARGVLRGGRDTTQVWADRSGTRMLSSRITSEPIVFPETQELLTVSEACARKQPPYLVLSFGLNGLVRFANDTDYYLSCYARLIDAIRESSPNTRILIQTVYPVRASGEYSLSVREINAALIQLNQALPALASRYENLRILDTASVLRDTAGMLRAEFAEADGIHLNRDAYEAVLSYLREHACNSPEREDVK